MSRWIDADDIIAEQKKYCFGCEDGEETTHCSVCFAKDIVSAIIHHTPSIDIVRCKECKWADWYTVKGEHYCHCIETEARGRTADDFCSYGERSEQ